VAVVIAVLYRPVEDTHAMRLGSFLAYVPWLVWQIVLSNLRVARIVLSPTMRISPAFVRQRPGVEGARALTLLGSSITLTPGTLTVDVDGEEIFVHALDTASADDVRAGTIARRVRRVCSQGEGEA
jgi:multicomponent Na+:H+ antiporter subunit E